MRTARLAFSAIAFLALCCAETRAQSSVTLERFFGIGGKQKPATPLLAPQGLADHVVDGKLALTLGDSIRLALSNNTDIRLDHSQIEFAQDNLRRVRGPFDPVATSSFADNRAKSPTITQIQGAPVLETLTQTTTFGYSQLFQTGTNVQASFSANKLSTNDSLSLLNPSLASNLQFTVTQPLLKNFGLFPNRAPILIAQRNFKQARANFLGEVNDVVLQIVGNYWGVVLARENLTVQKKSLEEAEKSYERDKKALSLGALPPLDIYRSQSQVATRRVGVIHAEYSLKQAEAQFRRGVGADLDPTIRVLDLDLTDRPEPAGELPSTDIATALARALANRPELERVHEQLANDELSVRSLNQVFHFTYPAYGASLSLTLPIRNHSGQANLADALVSRTRDQYQERQTNQSITLEVTQAVHSLEEAKLTMEAAKVAVDLARDTLKADERKYELGAEAVFFVLDAQTQLAQAELNLIQAQISYQLAVAQLDHATGDLLEHHQVQIVEPKM